jgi:hypothetical protein
MALGLEEAREVLVEEVQLLPSLIACVWKVFITHGGRLQ